MHSVGGGGAMMTSTGDAASHAAAATTPSTSKSAAAHSAPSENRSRCAAGTLSPPSDTDVSTRCTVSGCLIARS